MRSARRDDGFSLVELLTVIVILGVLAAIAVPTYLGQRQKAFRSAMVSDLRTLVTAQESRAIDGNPMYSTDLSALRKDGYQRSDGVSLPTIYLFDNNTPQFVACLKHTGIDEWLVYSSVDGVTAYSPSQCAAAPDPSSP